MPVAVDSRLLPLFFAIGRPFSPIYSGIMRLRAFFYQKGLFSTQRLPCPVISIGNITMGGTGKTPHVWAIVRHLVSKGLRIAVVSRGYGGRGGQRPLVVWDGINIQSTPDECGDEAFMLAEAFYYHGIKGVCVIVDQDRYRAGRLALEWGAQVIVLDDGFQYIRLYRDLDIVLLRHKRPLGNGLVFPGGDLREPLSALNRGDVFVLTDAKAMQPQEMAEEKARFQAKLRLFNDRPLFFSRIRSVGLRDSMGVHIPLSDLKDRPVLAFCGLADPEAFYTSLRALGANIKKTVSFSDHFAYKEEDVRQLMVLAHTFKCNQLITTHKDMVKLKCMSCLRDYASMFWMLEIDLEIDTDFWGVINHVLNIT